MKKKGTKKIFPRVLLITIVISAVSGLFFRWSVQEYEKGILSVAADQQDGYVQLVLDQINLESNRADDDIISNILSTLDASDNRYWAFTKDTTMLFVKDLMETYKYKGFNSNTYYKSGSAKEFYDNLKLNRVDHSLITMNDRTYVASGVRFRYNSQDYGLCLLTNQETLLENNDYLRSKVQMHLLIILLLFCFVLITSFLAWKYDRIKEEKEDVEEDSEELRRRMIRMNKKVETDRDIFDANKMMNGKMLVPMLSSLKRHGIASVDLIRLDFQDDRTKQKFIDELNGEIFRKVLRFELGYTKIILLMFNQEKKQIKNLSESMQIKVGSEVTLNLSGSDGSGL
jgi:hypothetical protein